MLTDEEIRSLPRGTKLEFQLRDQWIPCVLIHAETKDITHAVGMTEDVRIKHGLLGRNVWIIEHWEYYSLYRLQSFAGYVCRWEIANRLRLFVDPISLVEKVDGCICIDCKQFYSMAVANRPEGLVCYSCRSTNAWKY